MKKIEVKVYGKEGCHWCDKLTGYLTEREVPHTVVKVDWSPDTMAEFRADFPDAKTVPQTVADDIKLGGYHETIAWFNDRYERS